MAYSARVRLPDSLGKLLRSDMETAIFEANLGNSDSLIAKRYLLDQLPQADIAAEIGCTRATICERVHRIINRVEETADKLGLTKSYTN